MNKNLKGALVVISVLAIGGYIYLRLNKTKKVYAKTIIELNGSQGTLAQLMLMEEGYLESWARALKRGKDTFTFNNKEYKTQGGTAV